MTAGSMEARKPKRLFMNGDTACAEGAIAAGCGFFAGYPITPASEIAEHMARKLPTLGGTYIQMEDEIASMNAILGASWGGALSMTATSGPGFSLMLENLGLGVMTETPCVIVNVQRGGPSTGLPTLVGQADLMQARWGSHGDYEIIALSPSSPQECFDLTIEAFKLAEEYRTPVIILADEGVGHMTERVEIGESVSPVERRYTSAPPGEYLPFAPNDDGIPPMAPVGRGYNIHMTGLTHDERGYPVISAAAQDLLLRRLLSKIRNNADKIASFEEVMVGGSEVVVVSLGISSRPAKSAVRDARASGIKAGLLSLKTIWPFPENKIRNLAETADTIIVVEVNMGQIALEVERVAGGRCKVVSMTHPGGGVRTPMEILEEIRKAAKC